MVKTGEMMIANGIYTLERRGCKLHFWLSGMEGKPLLVFTHGATIDHQMFDEQLPALSGDYRILTWDMRGHGASSPMGEPFTVAAAMDDLVAILDFVGGQQAVFVGQSTGGYVQQELVFRQPERVAALVMVDCICITFKLSKMDSILLGLAPALMRMYPYKTLVKQSVDASSIKPAVREDLMRVVSAIPREDFMSIMSGAAQCIHYEPNYRIDKPMLIIRGEQDKLGNIAKDAPVWAARDHAKLVIIPDAGHVSNQDNPTFFNRVMVDFLTSLSLDRTK